MPTTKPLHPAPLLTERDTAVLRLLITHLALSRDQVRTLAGFGSVGRVNTRLLTLLRAGLIRRVSLGMVPCEAGFAAQAVYVAAPKAAAWVAQTTGQDMGAVRARITSAGRGGTRPAFLLHALLTAELRVAFMVASRAEGWDMEWVGEPACCHAFEARVASQFKVDGWVKHLFRPDSVLFLSAPGSGLETPTIHAFALEADRGHTAARQWADRFCTVRAFTESGLFARAYPHAASMMTLVVTESGRGRVENLLMLARDGGYIPLRVTTAALMRKHGPLAPIWFAPNAEGAFALLEGNF